MKKNTLLLTILSVLGVFGMLLLSGCDKEETLTPQDFAPPTNFRALSQSGAVILYWNRSSNDGVSEFAGYRVQTYNSSNAKIDSFMTTRDTARISGLTNGQTYSFTIRSVKSNGDVSVVDSIQWGPTMRHAVAARIYEYDSPNPSGLQFSSGNTFSFTSSSPDNRANIDLWIDGRSGGAILLKSPSNEDFSSTGWRTTKLYATTKTSLDQQVDFPAESAFSSTANIVVNTNAVYLAISNDGNYARFQVTAQGGTAPNRYIDVSIVYNSGDGAWAKK